jgi:hypothetical protein
LHPRSRWSRLGVRFLAQAGAPTLHCEHEKGKRFAFMAVDVLISKDNFPKSPVMFEYEKQTP